MSGAHPSLIRRVPLASRAHRLRGVLSALAALVAILLGRPALAATDLLAGMQPSRAQSVTRPELLTDGEAAPEGDSWNSTLSALFVSDKAYVEYDLGKNVTVVAAFLQGDNNDAYLVSISRDGLHWEPLWTAAPSEHPGLRDRWTSDLSATGRYVRLRVEGGDNSYGVTELQLFSEKPESMPPPVRRASAETYPAYVRTSLLYFVVAAGAVLFGLRAGLRRRYVVLGAVVAAVAAAAAFYAAAITWPLASREVAFVRASAASIALLAALRTVFPGPRWPPLRGAIGVALGASAIMAFAAFYNLGHAQFFDHGRNRPEFIHTTDMRIYHPFAKYYPELQYDGVYLASALAYAEDVEGGSLQRLGNYPVRDLRDHRMRTVRDASSEILAIKDRFTPERWAEFKADMRYWQDVLGPEYMASLTDHGANATPVWVFFARILLAHAPASRWLLTMSGAVDGVLLLLMAFALGRSFGLWPMLLAMTVFGANDIYMFGTNWTGATLRHDWLALLGFAAAALKKERWVLAGLCIGTAALIRAFPILALAGIGVPMAWTLGERLARGEGLPSWRAFLDQHGDAVRVLLTAAAWILTMFLVTGVLYGFNSWAHWLQKASLLNADVGVNEISLRALVSGADGESYKVLHARLALFVVIQVVAAVCMAVLARRRPLYQAMLLGLPVIWLVTHPSSYYSHFVFLFALFASAADPSAAAPVPPAGGDHGRFAPLVVPFLRVAFPLLALCIGGYWASLDPDEDRHFRDTTLMLFLSVAWLYGNLLYTWLYAPARDLTLVVATGDAPGQGARAGVGVGVGGEPAPASPAEPPSPELPSTAA